jgi:hypothetical protein
MKSAITLSLVEEARGGPFVFWGDAKAAISEAHKLGFDAIEIFPPDADTLRHLFLAKTLADHKLAVAAVGTGAGWVKHRLHLADEEPIVRQRAINFIKSIIDCAAVRICSIWRSTALASRSALSASLERFTALYSSL